VVSVVPVSASARSVENRVESGLLNDYRVNLRLNIGDIRIVMYMKMKFSIAK